MSMDENLGVPSSVDQKPAAKPVEFSYTPPVVAKAPVEPAAEKPTVKTLHDRLAAMEYMVASMADHVENSLGFKVARLPDNTPSEPDVA